jgi:hypothetical protein
MVALFFVKSASRDHLQECLVPTSLPHLFWLISLRKDGLMLWTI